MLLICSRENVFEVNGYFVANPTGMAKTNGSLVFFLYLLSV